jgi:hypothetical protein
MGHCYAYEFMRTSPGPSSVLLGASQGHKWSEVAMLILPAFCPDCNEPTMEVVEHRPDDSYEAQCTACGCHTFGKIPPELLITKRAIERTH